MTKIFTPSPEQAAFLDWIVDGSGSCVLEAVAGAGKTTTLIEGVKRMTGSAFLGAYNSAMGKELKERIKGIDGKRAGTFHSAGFSALCYANKRLREDKDAVDDKKVRNIVDGFVTGTPLENVDGLVSAVCQLVSMAKQTGFYVRGLVENVKYHYWVELINRHDVAERLPEDFAVAELVQLAERALRASNAERNIIDYDDMVYLPLLLNLRFFKNDWVLIDEAQDTNAVRRELARRMLKPGGRLVAVGDPHQAIFGFTGADNSSLDLIRDLFQARTMKLSVSWRCPRSVVAVARNYVKHIDPAPSAPAGTVSGETYRDMLGNVQPGTVVLCRFNAPLVELCFRLIREGKAAKIEGKSIGEGLAALVGRWKVKTLDALEGRLDKWNIRERAKIESAPKKDEAKLARHEDKYATILVLLDRARDQKMSTVVELQDMVRSMFADMGDQPNCVVLCSVHKSKGREWQTVRILGRGEIMPPQRQMQDWQMEQEINLCYVAVTRAQSVLIDVPMPTPADLKPTTEQAATDAASMERSVAKVMKDAKRELSRLSADELAALEAGA